MNELYELHLKGELSEKGYLKETYDNQTEDLKHTLTDLGITEIKGILKDPKMKREFLLMAIQEAKGNPEIALELIKNAMQRLK
jgi:hypothetical protein